MTQLSKSFSLQEFATNDRAGTPVPPHLVANVTDLAVGVLQPIRDEWTSPLLVVSGYRTLVWNTAVGGAKASTHLTAEGADIRPVYLRDVDRLHELILSMHTRGLLPMLGGLGSYPRWVHVDIRRLASGRLRRWAGEGTGSEP